VRPCSSRRTGKLVARDAYNGVVLWKKPLTQWLTRFWPWKSGPAQMPRKLIAIGDRVYAPLDINGPLMEFDAATGEQLRVYEETTAAEEVISTQGILLVVSNPNPPDMKAIAEETQKRRHFSYDGRNRVVLDHTAREKRHRGRSGYREGFVEASPGRRSACSRSPRWATTWSITTASASCASI
jgi:hypothetical protein